jgi:hypothetical protein
MPSRDVWIARAPLLTLAVGGAAALFHLAGITGAVLAYRPAEPSLPALLACHLAHFSSLHLRWDLLTFLGVSAVSEALDRRRLAAFLLGAALLVPPLACALEGWVDRYAGLSGLVVGQVAMWLAAELRRRPRVAAPLLLALLLKQLHELHVGNTSMLPMDYRGFHTVPAAHLVSALVGLLAGAVWPDGHQLAPRWAATHSRDVTAVPQSSPATAPQGRTRPQG